MFVHALVASFLLAVPGTDSPASAVARPAAVTAVPPPLRAVLHDTGPDGRLYALGADYKMCFGPDGARYIPALGPRAPRNLPIEFGVEGARPALPERTGDRVTFDRGALVEIYDLHLDHVEQSFLLRSPPDEQGLRVLARTELADAGRADAGLRFEAPGLATVVYGDATARDARGATLAIPVVREGASIRIDLPDAWRDPARYPVLVDPLIKTILVDGGSDDTRTPDVAYAANVNLFQVSYLRELSTADADVLCATYDANGNLIDTVALDLTLVDSDFPSVAYSAPHFMTVWSNSELGQGGEEVEARARVAGTSGISPKFQVSTSVQSHPGHATVGGGPNGKFLIAWQTLGVFSGWKIVGRMATAAGTQGGVFDVDTTSETGDPVVWKTATAAGRWLVVYERLHFASGSNGTEDLRARQVDTNGAVAGSAIDLTTFADTWEENASIAVRGNDYFVAFVRTVVFGDSDVWLREVRGGASPSLGILVNLTTLEPAGAPDRIQRSPSISFDGVRFALAYSETQSQSSASEIRAATFFVTPSIAFQESHVLIQGAPDRHFSPTLAGAGFDLPGKHFIAWSHVNGKTDDGDVVGGIWSSLAAGGTTVLDTGCGGAGNEPVLLSASVPALGTTCGVLLLNFHAPLIAFGPPSLAAACPGTGCQIGVSGTTFHPATSTLFTFSIGTSPSLLGTQFAIQGIDFQPPPGTNEVCTSASGPTFTTSDTIVFTVQ